MTEQERLKLKVKIARCKDCAGWITQACFPLCETSKDMQKEFAAHAKAGDSIDVMTVAEGMALPYCECYKLRAAEKAAAKLAKKAAKDGNLFLTA